MKSKRRKCFSRFCIHPSSFILHPLEVEMATADEELVKAEPPRVPAEARREPEVNKLFRMVMKHEGSDLHLKVGLPPMMRLKGVIRRMEMKPLTQEDMERLLYPTLKPEKKETLEATGG